MRAWLHAAQASDRARLRWHHARHPGLSVHPTASSAFAVARFQLAPGARLAIGPGAATERRPGWLNFLVHEGGEIVVEEGAWLRTEVAPVTLVAYPGGRLVLGPESFVNGAHLSAKTEVWLGRKAQIGPNSKLYDADQHDLDDARPEGRAPVRVGEHAWVASDVTVMKGVAIGAHSIVGARSVVNRDVPAHEFWAGSPAKHLGSVGDRSQAR
ncbi:MAG: acyltransferase [bacterium]|nr:acyltransferase [bacterium]